MDKNAKIYVAGHTGLVGSAITRTLSAHGYTNLLLRRSSEVDLQRQAAVDEFIAAEKPDYVFLAAAKVGGIWANATYPVRHIRDNLQIALNVVEASHNNGVKKLLFLGSSCIYPKLAPQPIREEYLLSGPLEPTNDCYAIAKIAGIKLCQAYHRQFGFPVISLMPTNLYGPGDNFDLETGHVLPSLMRKCHEAKLRGDKTFTVWGSGKIRREFLHVDDLAEACLFLMNRYEDPEIINVGTGEDISIRDVAEIIRDIVGFKGDMVFDASKPDGTPRKMLDVTRLHALGWKHTIPLKEGLARTYAWYLENGAAS